MPISNSRRRGIRANISPELDLSAHANGSTSQKDQYAYASPWLWDRLSSSRASSVGSSTGSSDVMGVAIIWPEEKRLSDKGKRKSLIIWVKRRDDVLSTRPEHRELFVPSHLIPRYSPTPLSALIYPHEPVELSLVILQPVLPSASLSDSAHLDTSGLDFDFLRPPAASHQINGHTNGYAAHQPLPRIIRQDETLSIPRQHGSPQLVRVLTQDPVQQGVITSQTRIILANTPHIAEAESSWTDTADAISESSHGRTHLSMANFDPDAFLSSSLDLHFSSPSRRTNGSPAYERPEFEPSSHSSTSGSITPRPNGHPRVPHSPPAQAHEVLGEDLEAEDVGTRFNVVIAEGPPAGNDIGGRGADDVCWMGVAGLGRAGIFEGDWVLVSIGQAGSSSVGGRLLRAMVWERLDDQEDDDGLPANPIMITPYLSRSLFGTRSSGSGLFVSPTSFGAREPTLPTARTITLARIATAEGVDKRYERAWLKGLQDAFAARSSGKDNPGSDMRLVKRGDVFSVPTWRDRPIAADETPGDDESASDSDLDSDDSWSGSTTRKIPTALAYFVVASLSYEPLNPLDEDFRSSTSSKARAGELGCWVDVGPQGATRMVLTGVERSVVGRRAAEKVWRGLSPAPDPFNLAAASRLRGLLSSCLANSTLSSALQMSILIKGGRGAGKTSLIRAIADEVGFNLIELDAYAIVGDTPAHTEGTILAALEKVKACAPSALVIRHIETLSKKAESGASGRPPAIVKVLEDAMDALRTASGELDYPCLLMGTSSDVDATPGEVLACFKQDVEISAPNEKERSTIVNSLLRDTLLDPAVSLSTIASQSAALQANDIASLIHRAQDIMLERALKSTNRSALSLRHAGLPLSSSDIDKALSDARASYSDSIGAPKIPNVRWEDVGGLANVKEEILETVQLPLERPELFAEGLKKRSGILLYGPPGTGKTLLAKAVATSCSLNFFSVKGPELLNMYIGESEANVRRVFQRARDASPCIIFMDELDSIAPKRGNQGDSGGVMDRIVSQLLAELDGMSGGKSAADVEVFVMGATNRPDLLDPALLRPGRFDRMLYLSVATTNAAQQSILEALTRKFDLDADLDLGEIARLCPFNYTGADFYALCSDAMLRAMMRQAQAVDSRIAELNVGVGRERLITPQYYLARMAGPEETRVRVGREDFVGALEGLVASVSEEEMGHYKRVQEQFKGYEIGKEGGEGEEGEE